MPQRGTRRWSWQTYWLMQAAVCWLILPVVVALITIPQLGQVLREAPAGAMRNAFVLGALYGIGGTAFGMAIRYVGFSLTYAISVGISCVLGTLLPPLYEGRLGGILSGNGGNVIIIGMIAGATGIALCGMAGRMKENDQAQRQESIKSNSFTIGIALCILSGVLSALYGFSLAQGQPIADVAARYGAGHLQGNVIYIFSNTGAFLSTSLYCFYLHRKNKTLQEYHHLKDAHVNQLWKNYALAILTGVLWYTQFFFYGLGHNRMGPYKFTSWAIHMILLVLISAMAGIVMQEWKNTGKRTKSMLSAALIILIGAVLVITYGNYLGEK